MFLSFKLSFRRTRETVESNEYNGIKKRKEIFLLISYLDTLLKGDIL